MKKIIVATVLIIVIAIAGSVFYVFNNLDRLVEEAIEKYGSEATQTSVLVDSVKVNLQDGAAAINGITIANPAGFQAPLVFSLTEVGSQIDLASLSEDVIVINDVRVRAPNVFVEVNKDNKVNLNVLKDNVLGATSKNSATEQPAATQKAAGAEPKIIIHRILFEEGFIDARVVALNNQNFKIKLPSFELNELGGKTGATPAEISQQVLKKLTDIALAEVRKKGIGQQLDKIKAEAKAKLEAKKAELEAKKAELEAQKSALEAETKQELDAKKEQAKDKTKEKLQNLFNR